MSTKTSHGLVHGDDQARIRAVVTGWSAICVVRKDRELEQRTLQAGTPFPLAKAGSRRRETGDNNSSRRPNSAPLDGSVLSPDASRMRGKRWQGRVRQRRARDRWQSGGAMTEGSPQRVAHPRPRLS